MQKSVWTATIISVVLALASTNALAQRGAVRGKVVDDQGQPIKDVEVTIQLLDGGGRASKTKTNDKGQFVKAGLKVGMYRVDFMFDGFQPHAAQLKVSTGEQADAGTQTLYPLAPGTLTEAQSEDAQKHLDAFNAAYQSGDFPTAIESMNQLLEFMPDNAEAYFNLAGTYEKNKDDDNALKAYEKVLELEPKFVDAHIAMGDIHARNKSWPEAQASLGKALEQRDTDANLHFNFAANAMNAGDMEAALEGFTQVTTLDPDHPQFAISHFQIGMIHVNQGRNDQAIPFLEKFLEVSPDASNAATVKELLTTIKGTSQQ